MTTEKAIYGAGEAIKERGLPAAILIMDGLSSVFLREALRNPKESPDYTHWKYLSEMCNLAVGRRNPE